MTRTWAILCVLVSGACGASVDVNDTADAPPGGSADAPGVADAPQVVTPADATPAPCTNGQAQAISAGRCYERFVTALPWTAAQAACQALGGTLAKIESAQENAVLVGLIGQADHWIGGTDAASEMTWVWYDGTPFVFTNWRSGEPNDGSGNFPEDCAIIEGDQGGTWDDRPCATGGVGPIGEYAYLCERAG
jgi:hypothetical protein